MSFVVEKDNGLIPQILSSILDECVNGVTLADPDIEGAPIVYANKAFERLTGYTNTDIIGHNCRFLQGIDRDQPERYLIADAMKNGQSVEVTLRNYRKDGELFFNHLKITPLLDRKGRVIYYLGVQYDVTYQVKAKNEIAELTSLLGAFSEKVV
ncbi:MAG: PAS domain-containing protein [Methylobacter sp.]|uniref:PAS domain-containing protein n=1 Tax=Methylovulum miyakonense TaxID=645578 RepID=UPI00037BDC61|nr:PAS domain-containing protein [Methylovulum miyakonense]PPD49889.1 MAG: PAS domain-containing protein [Methylobacter sp.]